MGTYSPHFSSGYVKNCEFKGKFVNKRIPQMIHLSKKLAETISQLRACVLEREELQKVKSQTIAQLNFCRREKKDKLIKDMKGLNNK